MGTLKKGVYNQLRIHAYPFKWKSTVTYSFTSEREIQKRVVEGEWRKIKQNVLGAVAALCWGRGLELWGNCGEQVR